MSSSGAKESSDAIKVETGLGLTLSHVFRFVLGGAVALIVCWLHWPEEVGAFSKDQNPVIVGLVILTAGAYVYAMYRPLLLEQGIQLLTKGLHFSFDFVLQKLRASDRQHTSCHQWLLKLGVKWSDTSYAVRSLRDGFFPEIAKDRLRSYRESNDQNHFLFVVGLLFLGGGVAEIWHDSKFLTAGQWVLIGTLSILMGCISDIILSRTMRDMLAEADRKQVIVHLKKSGFLGIEVPETTP